MPGPDARDVPATALEGDAVGRELLAVVLYSSGGKTSFNPFSAITL